MSIKVREIYDRHREHVGKMELMRKTAQAYVTFKPGATYGNRMMELDEVEEYMKSFGFMFEEDLEQITIDDLI